MLMAVQYSWHTATERGGQSRPNLTNDTYDEPNGYRSNHRPTTLPRQPYDGYPQVTSRPHSQGSASPSSKSSTSDERSVNGRHSRGEVNGQEYGTVSYGPNVYWNGEPSQSQTLAKDKRNKKKHHHQKEKSRADRHSRDNYRYERDSKSRSRPKSDTSDEDYHRTEHRKHRVGNLYNNTE